MACVFYGHCGALERLGERVPALRTKAIGSIDRSSEVEIRARRWGQVSWH